VGAGAGAGTGIEGEAGGGPGKGLPLPLPVTKMSEEKSDSRKGWMLGFFDDDAHAGEWHFVTSGPLVIVTGLHCMVLAVVRSKFLATTHCPNETQWGLVSVHRMYSTAVEA